MVLEGVPENKRVFARRLASGLAKEITIIKVAMNKSLGKDLNPSFDYATNLHALRAQSEDPKKALTAFLENMNGLLEGNIESKMAD